MDDCHEKGGEGAESQYDIYIVIDSDAMYDQAYQNVECHLNKDVRHVPGRYIDGRKMLGFLVAICEYC